MSTSTNIVNTLKFENDFIGKILVMKNKSLKNPVLTLEKYNQTMELINIAKLKGYVKRNNQDKSVKKSMGQKILQSNIMLR